MVKEITRMRIQNKNKTKKQNTRVLNVCMRAQHGHIQGQWFTGPGHRLLSTGARRRRILTQPAKVGDRFLCYALNTLYHHKLTSKQI